METIAGRPLPTRPTGPIARPAPGLNSIWPWSLSSSTPAPGRRGATAIQSPDQPSDARRDWDWPASPCSPAAHSRPIRTFPCGSMPASLQISALLTSSAACRSRMSTRWSALKAAPTCCAAWASWWPRSRTYSPAATRRGPAARWPRRGARVASKPDVFASRDTPRPGGLFDRLAMLTDDRQLPAPTILTELLQELGPIWPSRLTLGGSALGDCWKHLALTSADATSGLVPLHKLSQWLSYSLIEPLQTAGIHVSDIDGLTGLAEYRNGGLFVDIGVLAFREAEAAPQGERA